MNSLPDPQVKHESHESPPWALAQSGKQPGITWWPPFPRVLTHTNTQRQIQTVDKDPESQLCLLENVRWEWENNPSQRAGHS